MKKRYTPSIFSIRMFFKQLIFLKKTFYMKVSLKSKINLFFKLVIIIVALMTFCLRAIEKLNQIAYSNKAYELEQKVNHMHGRWKLDFVRV